MNLAHCNSGFVRAAFTSLIIFMVIYHHNLTMTTWVLFNLLFCLGFHLQLYYSKISIHKVFNMTSVYYTKTV